MADPCSQEKTIAELSVNVQVLTRALDKMSVAQEKFVTILEKMAAQGERISHLESGQDVLFDRLRQVELSVNMLPHFEEEQKDVQARLHTVELCVTGERVKVGGIVATVTLIGSALASYIFKKIGG